MTAVAPFPPFRPYAKDDELDGLSVRYGWFWLLDLHEGAPVAFDPDLVDPCRYGVTDATAFQNLVSGGPANVKSFECVEGWFARTTHESTWTGRHDDRVEALREAYARREAERARHADVDMSKFFKGL